MQKEKAEKKDKRKGKGKEIDFTHFNFQTLAANALWHIS